MVSRAARTDRRILAALHSKLAPGSLVLFVDQTPYDGDLRRLDSCGNTLEQLFLPDGRAFEIVKNFPTEAEMHGYLAGIADDVQYVVKPNEKSWSVTYSTRA